MLLALVAVVTACSEHIGKGWDWERMREQPKYTPYRSSAFFSDSSAMRTPPEGTVPAAPTLLVTPYAHNNNVGSPTTELPEQSTTLKGATPTDTALLNRGATQFHIVCAACHGDRADGRSLVASNMQPPKPPSLLTARICALPDTVLINVITYGFGRMPPLSAQLAPADRLAVIAYVRHLQLTTSHCKTLQHSLSLQPLSPQPQLQRSAPAH
jgi:mono/diheme cytochrome c family protein